MKYLSLFRLLISHFAKKVPEGVGGGEDCCDNCKKASRYVNVTTREREREREREIQYRSSHKFMVSDIEMSALSLSSSHLITGYEETDSSSAEQAQVYSTAAKLLLGLISVR